MIRIFWSIVFCFVSFSHASAQNAVSEAASGVASRTFEDWTLVCGPRDDPCRIIQALAGAKTEEKSANSAARPAIVFSFSVFRREGRFVAVMSAPLEVGLPAGIVLRVDGGEGYGAVYDFCDGGGCHASFVLPNAFENAFKRGNNLTAILRDRTDKEIELKLSLAGYTAASAALAEREQN